MRTALGAAMLVAAIGGIAAALDGDWDLGALFVVVLASQAGIAIALLGTRRMTTLRADLARWVDERSAVSGEPAPRIVDRCVAAYREGLTDPDA